MIFIVAFRNLTGNFKNSATILLLLVVIITLFFLGNTLLEEVDQGLRHTYVENYTGDVVIKAASDVPFSIFGANTPAIGEYFSIPVIKQHDQIEEVLESINMVESIVSLVSGVALMDMHGRRYKVPLFGIEGEKYFNFFKGIEIIEGKVITSGEEGVMMTENRVALIEKETGKRLVPGDPVLLTMFGDTGFKIREVPLRGIYTYKSSSTVLDNIMLIDVQSLRALNSITLASSALPLALDEAFFTDSIDDLFGSSDSFSGDIVVEEESSFSVDSILDILAEPSNLEKGDQTGGAWNFILLRVGKEVSDKKIISQLNTKFTEMGMEVEAVNWRTAAGLSALMVLLLQILYNGGFLLVVIAGIIAIINILIISIFERTGEIGTLRAIGASKSYIRKMIYLETLILSFVSGCLAVAAGYGIVSIINNASLVIYNNLIASLFGESTLNISFSPSVAVISMGASLLLGFLSSIFPVRMALGIEPVTAVTKGSK